MGRDGLREVRSIPLETMEDLLLGDVPLQRLRGRRRASRRFWPAESALARHRTLLAWGF